MAKTNPKSITNISFSIWPPRQSTCDDVTNRLIETLTAESVLSKRYGTVPKYEATDLAKKIEDEAFTIAGVGVVNPENDGIKTLQVYCKISKRMLEAAKSRYDNVAAHVPEPKEEEKNKFKLVCQIVEVDVAGEDGAEE